MKENFRYLLIDEQEEVCWVTINRPIDRNSLNSEIISELIQLLNQIEKTAVRALVFTGAGKTHFIGGADGIEMMQFNSEQALTFSNHIQNLFNRMEASPLILVAAINGLCFGGGYEFALACDLRVASKTARIGLPEVKVGLIPGGGGTQRLPRLVGFGRALEMILSGRLYNGEEAVKLGLVHLVVEPGELVNGVDMLLKPILRQPQYALSHAKRAVYASRSGTFADGLKEESEQFIQCFDHKFFSELMMKQIREGLLTTTADVSHLLEEEKKSR
ncbi:MAG: enoyl-CoA hydratase/isomerase family protein [Promethearchaeota archaeon]